MKKFLLYTFLLLAFATVVFCLLKPINKAKVFLYTVGIDESNVPSFGHTMHLVKTETYERYNDLDMIPLKQKEALKQVLKTRAFEKEEDFKLTDYFTSYEEDIKGGNVSGIGVPGPKFKHVYFSNKSLVLISRAGGCWPTIAIEFFELIDGEYRLQNVVSTSFANIFHFVALLKFEENVHDFANTDSVLEELGTNK